jgi:peptide/nickel transport system permease protein
MQSYVLRRILSLIPVLLVVSFVVYAVMFFTLGDPATMMMGQEADAQTVAKVRHELGLDRPMIVQYLHWLGNALRGDMGTSFRNSEPVMKLILQRFPVTLELTLLSTLVAILVGFPLGIFAALKENTRTDVLISTAAAFGVAMPNFWNGILLILLFGLILRWLPMAGYVPFTQDPIGNLSRMVLPTATLALYYVATFLKYVRASMVDVLKQRFVLTARARGVPERTVLMSYAFRSGLIPTVTVVGVEVGKLFAGAVVVETMFALPGMGRLVVDSIFTRDFPVFQAAVLFMAVAIFVSTLIVDILYAYLDPRIEYS